MADLVMGMWSDVGAPLAPFVFDTDAQGADADIADYGGYGIVGTPISRPYAQLLYSRGSRPGRNVTRLDGTLGTRHARSLVPTVPFSMLPDTLFDNRRQWATLGQGRWRLLDHITLGEGRAAFKLFAALAACSGAHHSRVMSLQDNMPTAFSWARGRSSAPAINYLLRRRAAHCTGAQITAVLPWVETTKQPADHASRDTGFGDRSSQDGPTPACSSFSDHGEPLSGSRPALRRVAH